MVNKALKYKNTDYLTVAGEVQGCRLYSVEHDRRVVLSVDYMIKGINIGQMPEMVANYAAEVEADKISVRIPGHLAKMFIEQGYIVEASVPGFYGPGEPLLMMSRQLSARRALASRVQYEEGYHLEIQYREGQAAPMAEDRLLEMVDRDQHEEAINFYLQHSKLVNRADMERMMASEPQVIYVRSNEHIAGVGALILETEGRVARIQGMISTAADEAAAQDLISSLWVLAKRQDVSCLYSITNTQDEIVNRILPANGFSFRGRLGADIIVDGVYGDRFVWSRD